MEHKLDAETIAHRVSLLSTISDNAVSERAAMRIGAEVEVLIDDPEIQEGRAAFQGPEVDGTVGFEGETNFKLGQWVKAVIIESAGADLIARPI
jgi:tRNA A37 methylthiotransferase MiaB